MIAGRVIVTQTIGLRTRRTGTTYQLAGELICPPMKKNSAGPDATSEAVPVGATGDKLFRVSRRG